MPTPVTGTGQTSEAALLWARLRRTPWRRIVRLALHARATMGRVLLPERLEGALYGHLCGDALGVPYEFRDPAAIDDVEWRGFGTYDLPPGTWSDDGALMLALLDSLLSMGFDTADQARRALAWQEDGAYAVGGHVFDIGNATRAALRALRDGALPESAGAVTALGNGSLMRILPVALVFRDASEGELVDMAVRASRVTHGSAEAQIACALYVLVARRLLVGETTPAEALDDARQVLRATLSGRGLPGSRVASSPAEAVAALDAFEAWTGREGRGHVVDSFWSAWDAFEAAPDYATCVTRAVRYGHDTDTTAAIAGGLAGIRFGLFGIPAAWRRGLRDGHLPRGLADRLLATDTSSSAGTTWRTSSACPLRVDLLDLAGTDLGAAGGRAGITFLPGKRHLGAFTGAHWRDLDADAGHLREQGVDLLLLLVEDTELESCRAREVEAVLPAHGVELVRHPVEDPRTPSDDAAYRTTVTRVAERVRAGATLAIACRGGLDRAGMTAACLLREAGLSADEAIERVHAARRYTLTLPEQVRYVKGWPHA